MKRLQSNLALLSALVGLAMTQDVYASPSTGPPAEGLLSAKEKDIAAQYPPLAMAATAWDHCDSELTDPTLIIYTFLRYSESAPSPEFADRRVWGSWCSVLPPPPAAPSIPKGGMGYVPATIV